MVGAVVSAPLTPELLGYHDSLGQYGQSYDAAKAEVAPGCSKEALMHLERDGKSSG